MVCWAMKKLAQYLHVELFLINNYLSNEAVKIESNIEVCSLRKHHFSQNSPYEQIRISQH